MTWNLFQSTARADNQQSPSARGGGAAMTAQVLRHIAQAIVVAAALGVPLMAQCAMCKSSVETTDNSAFVFALRDGIYLMLVTPYLIAAAIAVGVYLRWRKRTRQGRAAATVKLPHPRLN